MTEFKAIQKSKPIEYFQFKILGTFIKLQKSSKVFVGPCLTVKNLFPNSPESWWQMWLGNCRFWYWIQICKSKRHTVQE